MNGPYHTLWRNVKHYGRFKLESLTGKQAVHFLHVRKTGGSALKNTIRQNFGGRIPGFYFYKHQVSLRHIPKGNKVCLVVRKPESRFISGFYDRKRFGNPAYHIEWSALEKKVFDLFESPSELIEAIQSEDQERREVAEQALMEMRHVKSRLSDWLTSKDYVKERAADLLVVGFQDSLDQFINQLKSEKALPQNFELIKDSSLSNKSQNSISKELTVEARLIFNRLFKEQNDIFDFLEKRYG